LSFNKTGKSMSVSGQYFDIIINLMLGRLRWIDAS